MTTDTKTMTLRLDAAQASALEVIARTDDLSMAEAIRQAIDALIAERRNDEAFQARLTALVERERDVLERLAR